MRKPSALLYSVLKKPRKQRIEMPPSIHTPHTPWSRRRSFLIVAGLLALLVLGYLWVAWFLPETTVVGCSRGERAILEEFPHYGDQQQVRTYSAEVSCIVSYTLRVKRSEVLSYYDERLRENGWEVGGYWVANPPQGIEVFWREAVGPGGSPGGRSTRRPRSPSRRLQLRRRILPSRKPGCCGRGWGFGGRGHDSSICH